MKLKTAIMSFLLVVILAVPVVAEIGADEIRALNSSGLNLYEDSGSSGITIMDSGNANFNSEDAYGISELNATNLYQNGSAVLDSTDFDSPTFTTEVNLPANVYAETAIMHTGDTDTKVSFSADTMGLYAGGVERVTITGSYVSLTGALLGTNTRVTDTLEHQGDDDTEITFGTDTQDFRTGGSSRLDISDSGIRLGGANARVAAIFDQDDMTSNSSVALVTQQSIVEYVETQLATASGNTSEQVHDAIGTALGTGTGVDLAYDDTENYINASFDCTDVNGTAMVCTGETIGIDPNLYAEWNAGGTSYTNGSGLNLTGNTFSITQCADTEIMKYNATAALWECESDATGGAGSYDNGTGLLLTTTTFSIDGNLYSEWNTAYGWGDHSTAGYAPLNSPTFTTDVELPNDTYLAGNLSHTGDTNNYFSFGTDTMEWFTNGVTRMDLSNSGIRLGGANARVAAIFDQDDMTSNSSVALVTQQSIVEYVETQLNTNGGNSSEQIQDAVGGIVTNGDGVDITYNDGGDTITTTFDCSDVASTGLTCSGEDLTVDLGTAIDTTEITDGTIGEADLKIVDSPTDEHILTYESTTGDFEWHTCAEITGGAGLCDGTDADTDTTYDNSTGLLLTSTTFSIDSNLYTEWNTAYGWGDHGAAGYAASTVMDNHFDNIANFTGTLTNSQLCVYDSANTEIDCNIDYSGWDTTSDNVAGDVDTAEITDGTITEADLKIVDSPTDEHILTYESTTGDFEWHTCAEITGSADLCDGTDDGTSYTNGTGLNLTGTEFSMLQCPDTEIMKYNATSAKWECETDATGGAGSYDNGTGLVLTDTTFSVNALLYSEWNTAYNYGNHSEEGYITDNVTGTLTIDLNSDKHLVLARGGASYNATITFETESNTDFSLGSPNDDGTLQGYEFYIGQTQSSPDLLIETDNTIAINGTSTDATLHVHGNVTAKDMYLSQDTGKIIKFANDGYILINSTHTCIVGASGSELCAD